MQEQIFSKTNFEEKLSGGLYQKSETNNKTTTKHSYPKSKNFSTLKLLVVLKLLISILMQTTKCNFDPTKHLLEIDEKKLKKAIKRYDYFYLYINHPVCLQCRSLESELGGIAFQSRIEELKVRFFKINFLDNENFLKNLLDIRTIPQLYFFDNKLNYKFPLNIDIDFSYLPRLYKKLSGKFNMTNMLTAEQLNEISLGANGKKNMILLFNKDKSTAFNLLGKEIRNFLRLSVVAGYDTFYYCNETKFFEHFVKLKNPQLEFNDKSFYFLTGPIKNVTMQELLLPEKNLDDNSENSENASAAAATVLLSAEEDDEKENEASNIERKKLGKKAAQADVAEDEEKPQEAKSKSILNNSTQSTKNDVDSGENDFLKPYNFFKIDVEKLKEFENEQHLFKQKEELILDYFTYFKYNTYSSLGHAELADVIEMGKPTIIVFGNKNFLNDHKSFHREMFDLSKKYERKIKFYYSTLDSQYAKYFTRILNLRHSQLPIFLLIEKNSKEKNDFNKYKLDNTELSIEAVEKFIENYYAKKLPFYFVSQAQLDVTDETLTEAVAALNGTATDELMNNKFYNAGRNIYQIEGRHFESFLKHTLNRTVIIMACSFPMIHCRNGLEKLRFVTKTFNKFMDKVLFAETDPNFNEYAVSYSTNSNNDNNNSNITINNDINYKSTNTSSYENSELNLLKTFKFEDYFRYVFKPLYPHIVLFPATAQSEIISTPEHNLNSLIIKKLLNAVDFNEDFDCLKLIRFVGKHARIPAEQVEIDEQYLREEDVDGNIKLTADYDEDFLSDEELEKDSVLDSKIEDLKEMLGPDSDMLIETLKLQDTEEAKKLKKELVQAYDEIENKKKNEQKATVVEENRLKGLKEKDGL